MYRKEQSDYIHQVADLLAASNEFVECLEKGWLGAKLRHLKTDVLFFLNSAEIGGRNRRSVVVVYVEPLEGEFDQRAGADFEIKMEFNNPETTANLISRRFLPKLESWKSEAEKQLQIKEQNEELYRNNRAKISAALGVKDDDYLFISEEAEELGFYSGSGILGDKVNLALQCSVEKAIKIIEILKENS